MKQNNYIFNKFKQITTYMFNTYDDEIRKDVVLIDILELLKNDTIKVVTVVKNDDIYNLKSRFQLSNFFELRRSKKHSSIEFDVDYKMLPKFIEYAIKNSDRTELYVGNDLDKKTPRLKIDNDNYIYYMRMIINDNNQTYINVKNNAPNFSYLDSEIKKILGIPK